MPTSAYLYMEGQKLGLITDGASSLASVGNVFQESHQNKIMVQAFSHQVTVPRDLQFPHSTGPRVHKPLMISKVVDKSSPLLHRALAIRDVLTPCCFTWYRNGQNGAEIYYQIDLVDAVIVDIQSKMIQSTDAGSAQSTIIEDVYFTYRKIIWSHVGGNTTESDDLRDLNNA
ncbi:Hcp family type VI secretion system effector [Pseudomonas sp. GB2N2]